MAVVGGSMKLGGRCAGKDPGGVEGVAMVIFHCTCVSKSQRIKILNINF